MKYYSHYIWESGSVERQNPVSIVLQQVKLRKGRCLLVCICDGTGSGENASLVSGYLTERLVEWFHHKYIPTLQKKDPDRSTFWVLTEELKRIEEELEEYGRQKGTVATYDVLGMAVCDSEFFCFLKGKCKGYLFNRRFNKKQIRNLKALVYQGEEESRIQLVQGSMQKGVGILLCSPLFDTNISEDEMLEVLSEEHLEDGDIQKRLGELWKENKKRGENGHAGAVFFRTE